MQGNAASPVDTIRPKLPRIRPDYAEKIHRVKRLLAVKLDRDVTETEVFEMFLADCLDPWIDRVTANGRRGKKGEEER